MTMYNQLTPAQLERLYCLAEECGEVVQIIGKILRHGYNETHPDGGPTNLVLLHKELGDVIGITKLMCNGGELEAGVLQLEAANKIERVQQYLHHQYQAHTD